ncbi:MAG: TonB-dependent receptor [Gemmatimonadaceae bacterium]|nr:TonB-dependent receptor [Gemmatimonadaceae bacterium]
MNNSSKFPRRYAFVLLALIGSSAAPAMQAQSRQGTRDSSAVADDSVAQRLNTMRVSVTRETARSPFELPFALTTSPLSARPALRRTSVSDLLLGVPGVQVQDRSNPSQDARIAVRGFGARSAFGVRGVRVLRDGIPLSLPDGQTPIDWLDLETVERVDIVRGTAAALYGNAAGGVVDVRSRAPSSLPLALSTRIWNGGGVQRTNVQGSGTAVGRMGDTEGTFQRSQWLASFTRTAGDGPRTWSRLDATSVFARALSTVGGTRFEVQGTAYDAPRAENTGALTAAEMARDPRLPDSLNITRRSRKAVQQTQISLTAARDVGNGEIRGSLFGGTRMLENPLPFAIVEVDRRAVGGGLHGSWRVIPFAWPVRFGVGVDAQQLVDERYNYENCADVLPTAPVTARCPVRGAESGATRLDQQERAANVGGYTRIEVEAPHALFASVAMRYDQVRFRVQDRFINATNLDDSGNRTLGAVSPMLGLTWRARPRWSMYANLSTAFETPTATELTNQESGAAGLNSTLEPQRTRTLEFGTQALIGGRVRADLALFHATVLDELVPFDVPNQPGRRAFRNAGETTRRGAESSVRLAWSHLDIGTAYTWSHFRFDRYNVGTTSFAGRAIPGVPEHYLQGFATTQARGVFATLEWTAASEATADDAGTVKGAGYAVWAVRMGATSPRIHGVRLEPTVAVENIFDRRYASSLIINATRNRYFEPGLPRRLSAVVQVRWD